MQEYTDEMEQNARKFALEVYNLFIKRNSLPIEFMIAIKYLLAYGADQLSISNNLTDKLKAIHSIAHLAEITVSRLHELTQEHKERVLN